MEFDPLTGLLNRRAFWDSIQGRPDHWATCWRMGLALIDLDGFGRFNEEHGHDAGDAALRCVAGAIPRTEPHEWVSRYGGDEFAVLLAISERSEAEEWAGVARARIVAAVEQTLSATLGVRIGIAVGEPGWWPSDIYSEAITPADAALGQAFRSDPPGHIVVTEMYSDD